MPTDFQITEAMLTFGGSFVQALARAWRCADRENQDRLHDAFPDVWADYRDLIQRARTDVAKPTAGA